MMTTRRCVIICRLCLYISVCVCVMVYYGETKTPHTAHAYTFIQYNVSIATAVRGGDGPAHCDHRLAEVYIL